MTETDSKEHHEVARRIPAKTTELQ